jgi:predicted nucleic-acid-binding protein
VSALATVDTNVLVRILFGDDPGQARRALALVSSRPVWIAKTVLLETVWVLRSAYSLPDQRIRELVAGLLGIDGVSVEDRGQVVRALGWWAEGLDFADALHLASSPEAERFVTFDRELVRAAKRSASPPPVVSI